MTVSVSRHRHQLATAECVTVQRAEPFRIIDNIDVNVKVTGHDDRAAVVS